MHNIRNSNSAILSAIEVFKIPGPNFNRNYQKIPQSSSWHVCLAGTVYTFLDMTAEEVYYKYRLCKRKLKLTFLTLSLSQYTLIYSSFAFRVFPKQFL